MVSATDGSAFTGSVTVAVTGNGGTQATGSVGSGACTHEGNGFHTYAPAQAETNYDHVAFTFTGSGAIPVTVQIYTSFPQTGDSFARLGAPAGASVSADIAAIEAQTDDIGAAGAGLTAIPWNSAWDAEVQSECADALAAYDPPTNAELVSEINAVQSDIAGISAGSSPDVLVDTTIATLSSQTSFTLTAGSSDNDAYNGMAVIFTDQSTAAQKWVCFVDDYVGSTKTVTLESAPGFTIATGDEVAIMAAGGSANHPVTVSVAAADIRTAVGLASANLDTQLSTIDTNVDAILVDTGTTLDGKLDTIDNFLDTEVAAIKAKTDQLTFTVTGQVDANAESMNATEILGTGTSADKWRGE